MENDAAPLTVANGTVQVSIPAFGHATVRLESGAAPGKIAQLTGAAVAGESLNLSWERGANAVTYAVYRSLDPQDPPTAYTLVARSAQPSFADTHLDPGFTYYYRVASLTCQNMQSEVSSPVAVHTLDAKTQPPAPVDGLTVVRLSKSRLMLAWRKNAEPDVARYRVYRGDGAAFSADAASLIATTRPNGYFLESYIDEGLSPGHAYFYRVEAEDWAGHRQSQSPVVSAATPK